MKIEDDLRATLNQRVSRVTTDEEAAWVALDRRGRRTDRSRRVAAGLVAVVVTIGAFALVVRAFHPTATVQPSAMPSYSSAAQIFDLLNAGGANCAHQGGFALSMGLKDTGTCEVEGHQVSIRIYGSPEIMQAHAQPPTTAKDWAGVSWVRGANWFIATDDSAVAAEVQAILGGEVLGGTGHSSSGSAAPPSGSSNPFDRPKLKHVQIVPQRVVASSPDMLIVEAPVGEVRWKLNKECGVTGAPVGGSNAGGFGGGGCDGGALAGNVGGLSVSGTFYDMIRGHAYFGQEVTVRATFVDGTSAEVATHNGMWMIVYRPKPDLYSPSSHIATVEAISSTGQVLDRIRVP
jgi:hypothetical protein